MLAPEPDDAGTPRVRLQPVEPPPSPRTRDKVRAVYEFCERIVSITDDDYGDWMRRANLYWLILAQVVSETPGEVSHETSPDMLAAPLDNVSSEVLLLLAELHDIIQYHPNWHLVETRRLAVQMALKIAEALGAEPVDMHRFAVETGEH